MHISQNVGHKFLVVLIRRNCLKIVIYFHIYIHFFLGGGRGGGWRLGCVPPPKKEVSFSLTVKIWLFSVKRSKPGGSAPDNQDSFELIIFLLLLACVICEKFDADHKEELKVKFHDYHIIIYTNVNHSSNYWAVIHHFERIKLQYWTVIAVIIFLWWWNVIAPH